ncbi:hypothetical protein [Kribbella sp. NPDC051770]|uniref:hypothetical protein n=1 Tax=Kribbella sp. NPDC051770 TaxID=3155413 RepID=UPI0034339B56
MKVLYDGPVRVSYFQLYVMSGGTFASDPAESNHGQVNGLCGAALPGTLFLTTGLHFGHTTFTVELYDDQPPVDSSWEEVVEVSFRPVEDEVALVEWAGEAVHLLELPGADYRVRYCASGMDAAADADTVGDDEPALDRYLLQFWPAKAEPDVIVKQTSEMAKYWHQAWKD